MMVMVAMDDGVWLMVMVEMEPLCLMMEPLCLMMAWSHDASFCPVMVVAWMIEPLMMVDG